MAWTLDTLKQSLDETKSGASSSEWNAIRDLAWERLQQVGLPRPRSDAFFWIPLSLLQSVAISPSAAKQNPAGKAQTDLWRSRIPGESDCVALIPAMLATSPSLTNLPSSPDWQELEIGSNTEYDLQEIHVPDQSKVRIKLRNFTGSSSLRRFDLHIGAGCEVEILDLQSQMDTSALLQHFRISVDTESHVYWFSLDCGHKIFRNSIDAHLIGKEAQFEFRALSILDEENHSHRRIRVWHSAPGVRSEQFIRHVLLGHSNASCDTQVEITRGTKGTKAHQLVNSLLLSPQTKASAKPTLIINNDEVEASHGTTCGDLDAIQLFYLQSRGLSATQARRLLLSAFVDSIVSSHPTSHFSQELPLLVKDSLSRRLP